MAMATKVGMEGARTYTTHEGTEAVGLTANARRALGALRIAVGSVFLWAFLDKLLGLGFSTKAAGAWLAGGSPTAGFLGKAAYGPFAGFYHGIAGNPAVDALFMLGLLGVGLALVLGMGMRVAAAAGVTMLALMYTALIPPTTNPVVDDHVVYAIVLGVLALTGAGRTWGLGWWWSTRAVVQRHRWLE